MFLIRSKKAAVVFLIATFAIITSFFISCQKELSSEGLSIVPPNLTTKINSSVSGFVTDENELAVESAEITIGDNKTFTDKNGFFEIKNTVVVKEAAVVTVAQPGYFKAIKTYLATAGKSAFFRIKLLPKIIAGKINAITGGNITLGNGLTLTLPANGVVNAGTQAAYTGQVNVAAHWINPTNPDLNRIMPGDLRGTDTTGALKILTTYGMAAVELTGNSGELLQMAIGKKATLTIPLPAALATSAPSAIPLWYLDEITGLWKEEGKAVKSANSYIGEVSHFSYWNCDMPSNYVRFNCTVTNAKGIPIQNALVKISVVGNPNNCGYGYTDSSGFASGAVPINSSLLLEVFGEYNCLTGLYAKNFTTNATANVSLGKLILPAALSATVSGNVNDCNNLAVTNGYVLMRKDGIGFYQALGKSGTFNFTTTLCSNNRVASFVAEDKSASKASDVFTTTLIPDGNAIGTLLACSVSTQQFLNYAVNGINYSYTAPADSLFQYAKPQNTPPLLIISAANLLANSTQQVSLLFIQSGIAVNSSQNLMSFGCPQINNLSTIVNPIAIKITEYGIVGQFIAGNFTGIITGPAPGNTPYNVTCSFRVRRYQ